MARHNGKKKTHKVLSARPATDAEKLYYNSILEKEVKRYEVSKKIGGTNDTGGYKALHYRAYYN